MTTGDRQVAGRLRGQVLAAGPRYRGARLPPPLRAELIAYARAQRATGVSLPAIGKGGGLVDGTGGWLVGANSKYSGRRCS